MKPLPCVIGIDVGGTNTDAVYLQNDKVLAWHKTPTTPDIQSGVETAIEAIVSKANISRGHVDCVKIGTTVRAQFIPPWNSQKGRGNTKYHDGIYRFVMPEMPTIVYVYSKFGGVAKWTSLIPSVQSS